MPEPQVTAAHDLARELRKQGALLLVGVGYLDPKAAGATAASLWVAAEVIEALANELLWAAENGDELGQLLCSAHAWAQCELEVHGPGEAGGYQRRHDETARALSLGLKALVQLERLTRAVARS